LYVDLGKGFGDSKMNFIKNEVKEVEKKELKSSAKL